VEAIVVAVVGVLVFAVVGFIVTIKRLLVGKPELPAPPPQQTYLGRADKLEIVRQVLGPRMPEDLAAELGRLRGWVPRPPATVVPAVDLRPDAPAPLLAAPVAQAVAVPAQPVVGFVAAATALVDELAEAVQGSVVIEDDRPLRVSPEVAAAAERAPSWVRSFLSFENTIFLLAACLVLGGTLYVVATTWGRVPGRWQYLFLEGVILFYGSASMAAATFLDRRLRLSSAAHFLGATCGITMIAAALVAGATFMQFVAAGMIGAGLVAVIGTAVARALLRMTGARGAAAALFGVALLLLSGAGGFIAAERPVLAALLLIAAVAVGGPAWLATAGATTRPTLAVALAFPAATLLFPIAGWLPAAFIAPAIATGGSLTALAGGVFGGLALALALVALDAAAAGFAGTSIPALASVALLGLPASLMLWMRATPTEGEPAAASARQVVGVLSGALWIALAGLWARAVGLLDPAALDVQVWAWDGASALPFALLPLWLAAPRALARRPLARSAEAVGWIIVLGAVGMALAPFPELRMTSAAVGIGASGLAYTWARRYGTRGHWIGAHVLALSAIWILARAVWPAGALAVAATGALVLLLLPSAPAWIVGALAVPAGVLAAAIEGAPSLWLAGLLAGYGTAHLVRPVPAGAGWDTARTRPLGPPALLAALGVALFYMGGATVSFAPLLPIERWPQVLAAALVPMAVVVAWRGGPPFLVVETMVGIALAAVGGAPLPALALACGLLLGRPPGALAAAAVALVVLLPRALIARVAPIPCALLLALAGATLAARPLPTPSPLLRIRWLAAPALFAAPLVLAFQASKGATCLLDPALWPAAAAAVLLPFTAVIVRRGLPVYLRIEVLASAAGLAAAALLAANVAPAATRSAILAGVGALVALGCGLAAAQQAGENVSRPAWVLALLLSPAAVVPMTVLPLRWPAAIVGVAAVLTLGAVSRRRSATEMGAWALSAGLGAVWWGLGSIAKHYSTGAAPVRILPALAIGTAFYGMLIALDGRRLAAASTKFLRSFTLTLLALAGAALVLTGGAIDQPGDLDAALALTGLVSLGGLALVVAFVYRIGWPFYLAETTLGAGYAYLRARTSWLDAFAGWDGAVAAVGGVVCSAAARWLRRARSELGVAESRRMAMLFPLLSSFLLRPHDPRTSAGTALAAALLLVAARTNALAICGWLGALMANLSLLPLWASLDVTSPVAYALPAGVSLMILGRLYGAELGSHGPALRTLASLLIFGSTSYEMFQFQAVWPAVLQGASAVAVVLFGIRTRVRGYLYIGFTALLLDIVANLTRWGMHDRLVGGVLGVLGGMVLFALGTLVAHHKTQVLERYRRMQSWPW
jgi:hypothetical protein